MRALGGLLFLAAIVAIFMATVLFGTLATVAVLIMLGLESAWAFVRRGVARITRG